MQSKLASFKIVVEKDYPPPTDRCPNSIQCLLRDTIAKLGPGESFVWPENYNPYRVAKLSGVSITARKLNGTGYRIWRRFD